ncbi:Macrophage colony-stimulating factor 1 receptor CSF-1 receptor [Triplophysa tibetana]|uniref:Macrophage colony-stimulating factor 1 receptor CSF-1 receptor n=1 Tax=Triplophysa tibetana TaxID=1572043 RepID=A0A5A9PH33_9TELE|nr:Macrophage colony-stimulating factor 1 receptor CSF-1 receptor [Triplophysa tibetana]
MVIQTLWSRVAVFLWEPATTSFTTRAVTSVAKALLSAKASSVGDVGTPPRSSDRSPTDGGKPSGMTPYPNVVVDAHFYKMIKEGYHMSQPDFAPPEMYTIMKMCWTLDPTLRPNFSNISEQIATLLSKELNQQQMPYPEFQRQLIGKECILAPESLYREETRPLMNSSFI